MNIEDAFQPQNTPSPPVHIHKDFLDFIGLNPNFNLTLYMGMSNSQQYPNQRCPFKQDQIGLLRFLGSNK